MILRKEKIIAHHINHMNQSSDYLLAKLESCYEKSFGGVEV